MCGEQSIVTWLLIVRAGSSPRVRGTGHSRRRDQFCGRFIPACAGNSRHPASSGHESTVHPRVCGEQAVIVMTGLRAVGSSPRVRGTGIGFDTGNDILRFIPACAGNRFSVRNAPRNQPVHPRVCGEQFAAPDMQRAFIGSSPRVRGTDRRTPHCRAASRFIPACAGNSKGPARSPAALAVHPRVCGEQEVWKMNIIDQIGSSPRVRGTDCSKVDSCAKSTVHPRVCGEQSRSTICS